MPTIKKTAPLLPEGEYCGQARRVTMEWSKPKVNPDGSKTEPYPIFRIPLHIPGGQVITAIARVLDSTGWVFENICKSGDLVPPEGEEFVMTADDLENRKFFFGVVHSEYNGQKRAEVKFHAQTYAEQVNPVLKGVSFPREAPRGLQLRAAAAPSTSQELPPEASGAGQVPKSSTQPPVAIAEPTPTEEPETLSDKEFAEAIEYAKKLKQQKEGK
jgi:hypothetical protein